MTEPAADTTAPAVAEIAEAPTTSDSDHDNTATGDAPASWEDKVHAKKMECKDMKVSELKMKLMAKGILTSTFCEKEEFVRAYAEALTKEEEGGGGFGLGARDRVMGLETPAKDANDDKSGSDDEDAGDDHDGPAGGIMDQLPLAVQHRVDALKEIHEEREDMMKEYLVERARLEAKFDQRAKAFYDRRKGVVLGEMDEDIAKKSQGDDTTTSNTPDENDVEPSLVGIPQFWAITLNQMPVTGAMIAERDVDCLGYLEDITCDNYENGEGFQLNFQFAPNEYFENSVLTKRYNVPNLLLADEPILKNVEGCEILWKEGKSLMEQKVTKKQRGKGKNAGQVRTVTTTERTESFFQFFTPPKMPAGNLQTTTEDEVARLEAAFDEDYDVAQALRSHIVPKAVQWFAGDAMEQEIEAAMAGMEWPPGTGGSTTKGEENPECKQQ